METADSFVCLPREIDVIEGELAIAEYSVYSATVLYRIDLVGGVPKLLVRLNFPFNVISRYNDVVIPTD
jgi:hypothetical protein